MLKTARYHFAKDLTPRQDCEVRAQWYRARRLALVEERNRQARRARRLIAFLGVTMVLPQAALLAYAVAF